MSRLFRMFSPANHPRFQTQRGQLLEASAQGWIDVVQSDAEAMQHAGWTLVSEIGPTGSRPRPGPGIFLKNGHTYHDTDVGQPLFLINGCWVDIENAPR